MRRLAENQELVEGVYTQASDQFQTDGQSYPAEVVHCLVEGEAAGISKGAVSSPELVFDNISRLTKQYPPRLLLPLDHVSHDSHQLVEELLLRLPERGLVRDLEEVAHHLTPLAVQPAIGEAHLLQSGQHLSDLFREHEARQMDQHRRAHAGACVRRAGGEIAELR